jgi:hypothetical protein
MLKISSSMRTGVRPALLSVSAASAAAHAAAREILPTWLAQPPGGSFRGPPVASHIETAREMTAPDGHDCVSCCHRYQWQQETSTGGEGRDRQVPATGQPLGRRTGPARPADRPCAASHSAARLPGPRSHHQRRLTRRHDAGQHPLAGRQHSGLRASRPPPGNTAPGLMLTAGDRVSLLAPPLPGPAVAR